MPGGPCNKTGVAYVTIESSKGLRYSGGQRGLDHFSRTNGVGIALERRRNRRSRWRGSEPMSANKPEFSGLKGRFFAWFLTSPLRRVLDWKMGKPDQRVVELLALTGSERVLDAQSTKLADYRAKLAACRAQLGR